MGNPTSVIIVKYLLNSPINLEVGISLKSPAITTVLSVGIFSLMMLRDAVRSSSVRERWVQQK